MTPLDVPGASGGVWDDDEPDARSGTGSGAERTLAQQWLAANGFDPSPLPVPSSMELGTALDAAWRSGTAGIMRRVIVLHAGGERWHVEACEFPDGSAIAPTATTRFHLRSLHPVDGRLHLL